ncbi:MAG: hypothetical protein AAB692_02320, partial [Patescibacteria group bacterium]
MKRTLAAIAIVVGLLPPLAASAKSVPLKIPDIKDDFCGSQIDFRMCKCAFHGEYCKELGRDKKIADFMVRAKYAAYVAKLRVDFALACKKAGG